MASVAGVMTGIDRTLQRLLNDVKKSEVGERGRARGHMRMFNKWLIGHGKRLHGHGLSFLWSR